MNENEERAYWAEYIRKSRAEALKAEKDARWYPWLALLLAVVGSAWVSGLIIFMAHALHI